MAPIMVIATYSSGKAASQGQTVVKRVQVKILIFNGPPYLSIINRRAINGVMRKCAIAIVNYMASDASLQIWGNINSH